MGSMGALLVVFWAREETRLKYLSFAFSGTILVYGHGYTIPNVIIPSLNFFSLALSLCWLFCSHFYPHFGAISERISYFCMFYILFFVFVSSCYIRSPFSHVHGSFDDPAEFMCMRASFIFFSFLLKCNFIFRSTSWNVLNREIEKLLDLPHTEQFKYTYSNRKKCLINTHGEGCSMLRQTT